MSEPAFPLDKLQELDPKFYLREVSPTIEGQDERTATDDLGSTAVAHIIQLAEAVPEEADPYAHDARWDGSALAASGDSTKQYLHEISRVPLLDGRRAEAELSKRIEAGLMAQNILGSQELPNSTTQEELEWLAQDGTEAFNQFVEANLRLVVSIARKYSRAGVNFLSMLDLTQAGDLGLIRAVQKFDYQKGWKFSTYATWWIQQAITREINSRVRTVRYPIHIEEGIRTINRVKNELLKQHIDEPDAEQILTYLNKQREKEQKQPTELTVEKIAELIELDRKGISISLDQPIGDDNDAANLGDVLKDSEDVLPEDHATYHEMVQILNDAIDTLGERNAGILRLRRGLTTGKEEKLGYVAETYGLTVERVRQIVRECELTIARIQPDLAKFIKEED